MTVGGHAFRTDGSRWRILAQSRGAAEELFRKLIDETMQIIL